MNKAMMLIVCSVLALGVFGCSKKASEETQVSETATAIEPAQEAAPTAPAEGTPTEGTIQEAAPVQPTEQQQQAAPATE